MKNKCNQCGICCKLFLINLTETEYRSGKYKLQFEDPELFTDFQKAKSCGANTISQNPDGSCIYLQNNRCSIHKFRPQVCRDFFCKSKAKKFLKMIRIIEKSKNLNN